MTVTGPLVATLPALNEAVAAASNNPDEYTGSGASTPSIRSLVKS